MWNHKLPEQRFVIEPTLEQVVTWWNQFVKPGVFFVDIETAGQSLRCIGVSCNESDALCVPLWCSDGTFYWKENEALQIVELWNQFFYDDQYKKVMQNGVFDTSVLEGFGFVINSWVADTMLMHHLVYSELKHSLAFLHSVYVRGNYYKDMFHAEKDEVEE